jgi:hypothetical protein
MQFCRGFMRSPWCSTRKWKTDRLLKAMRNTEKSPKNTNTDT